jgi:RNA polymerase sigma factor (sigma-70 family)
VAYSDKEVLEAIRSGKDDLVLKYLYKTLLPRIKKYIISNSGDENDAKDIFQDAVMIFYKYVKLGKFDESNEIGAFVYTVSRNLWINVAKKRNRSVALTEETPITGFHGDADQELISQERETYVVNMFSKLGETCKTLLMYATFNKLSMKEIAEKMGFNSENVAKTKHYKCKQRLIELVKENTSVKDILQG